MAETTFIQTLFTSAWGILLVLIFFNGSIIIHELGHFLAARWRGLQVDRFSLFGLGPKLVSWMGKDGVEYCICAIPFGAYVALPQMAEISGLEGESEGDKKPLPPLSYADKMYVAFAGPFFNLCLAVIVACVGWYTGYPSYEGSETPQIGYVARTLADGQESPGKAAGLEAGDTIIAIDGEPVESYKQVPEMVVLGSGRDEDGTPKTVFTIDRAGQVQDIVVYPRLILNNQGSGDRIRQIGIEPTDPMVIGSLGLNSPAIQAGMQLDDEILSVNGQKAYSVRQIGDILNETGDQAVTIEVKRGDEVVGLEAHAKPIPTQSPALHLFLPGAEQPAFEIIPAYAANLKQDPALLETPSEPAIFTLEPGEGIISTQGEWRIAEVNGQPINSLAELANLFQASEGPVMLTLRNTSGQIRKRELPLEARLQIDPPSDRYMLLFGTMPGMVMIHQNPIIQFEEHIVRTFRTLGSLISPNSDIQIRHLSGVVGITTSLYKISQYDWRMVFWFAVLLNINLAILNLLPIPVLDGGHMMIATLNKLSGRKIPVGFIHSLQYVFVFLLLGVMCYVLYFDSMREVGYHKARQEYAREASRSIPLEFRPERYN